MARKQIQPATASDDIQPVIPCAHESCGQSAMCRIKLPTGWARLCLSHYEAHFRDQGQRAMVEHGLVRWSDESRVDFGKRVREYWRLLAKKSPMHKGLKDAA